MPTTRQEAMRELAALSFDPDSRERGLEDEINRNAWGITARSDDD